MSVSYTICGEETQKLIKAAMDTHHANLSEAGVTVHAIFAESYNKDGERLPAVKVHGIPASAKVSITSLEDRVRGIADAKMTIDRGEWGGMSESRKIALLDHELTHLVLLKLDDIGRPTLKLRHHDWELTGFAEVVERHGEASCEAAQFARFEETYGQLMLFDQKTLRNIGITSPIEAIKNRKPGDALDKAVNRLGTGVKLTDDKGEVLYEK
jgi:hypothetical protein